MVKEFQDFHGFFYDADDLGDLPALASGFLGYDDMGLMIISGSSGCGKTTLAGAFITEARQQGKAATILTVTECTKRLIDRIQKRQSALPPLDEYMKYDLIILEEYDHIFNKMSTQHEVRKSLLEPLLAAGKRIIITFLKEPGRTRVIKLPAHIRICLVHADAYARRSFARAYGKNLGIELDRCTELYLALNDIHVIKGLLNRAKLNDGILPIPEAFTRIDGIA